MKIIGLPLMAVIVMIFLNCSTYVYNFSLMEPRYTDQLFYSDSLIDIAFSFPAIESRVHTTYEGVFFSMNNKTDSIVIIDWNKISFIDVNGSSGHSVMHNQIKFNECSSYKPPSTVTPHGRISDIIIPCYGVEFHEGNQFVYAHWSRNMIPPPDENHNVTFGFFMPISFGTIIKNYNFSFKADPSIKLDSTVKEKDTKEQE